MVRKLIIVMSVLASCIVVNAQKTSSISIDGRTKYQHVTGFGGFSPSPQWQYWLNDSQMDMLFGKGDNQLGYNILRLYIANNKNGWSSSVANAKRAKKYGAFIFASPWSPPASWKSNNSDSNGGSLLESRYADWANFLNDYYTYMKGQGVEIDAVSIQNEPDWKAEYQSCIWTGEQMAKFLKQQGSKIKCKIIAPEAINFAKNMHEPILNDAEACKYLDIVGGHFYGWNGSSYPLAAEKGKEVWMTEFLINERQNNEKKNIDWKTDGFLFARSINDAMLANMSAWVHYSLKRFYGCIGDGEYGTTNNAITKRGYILSHYAKYVSGTTRVRHSLADATGKLTASAYLAQSGDSVVVMLINTGADTHNTTLSLPFNTKNGMQVVTTETQSVKKTTLSYDAETYAPVMNVAPYSVNTYIFKKSSARQDIPEEDPKEEFVFKDNFASVGASCIPNGWRAKAGTEIRDAGQYSLGPRLMSFSAEGDMTYGFYFRSEGSGDGYITYGEKSNYRLTLAPGQYTMKYSVVGWKANPTVTAAVRTTSGTQIVSKNTIPKSNVSATGVRITSSTDDELDFTLTATTNCVLKFSLPQSSDGFKEILIGNIALLKHEATGIVNINADERHSEVMYDLSGRKVNGAAHHGVYIMNGRKVVVK